MLGSRIFTRDNALLPAIFSWAIVVPLLIAMFRVRDIGQVIFYSTIVSGLIWFVSMNLVQLDPNYFLVVENWTQRQVAEDWTRKRSEDWIRRGAYKIIEYNNLTCGYAWLPISHVRKGMFFAGRIPLEPLIIRGLITTDNQIVEIELGLSYKLDPSAETCWAPDKLARGFNWEVFARETAEETVRTFVAFLKLRDLLEKYREDLLQSELEDALNMALTTTPVVMELENVLIPTIAPLEPTYSVIMSSLPKDQQRQVQEIWAAIESDKIKRGEMMHVLGEMEETLRAIRDGRLVASLNPALEGEIRDITVALTRDDLTITQKFKFMVPIIPLVLNWEAEMAKSWKIDPGRLWKALISK